MKSPFRIKTRGFTLVEMLVVVTILVLLASVATLVVQQSMKAARDEIRFNDMQTLKTALVLYAEANGGFPKERGDDGNASTKADNNSGSHTLYGPHLTNPLFNQGLICRDCPHKDNPINQIIEDFAGEKMEDPKHDFSEYGNYYYYDGSHACLGAAPNDDRVVLITIMETDKYANYATEISPECFAPWDPGKPHALNGFGREGVFDLRSHVINKAYIIMLGNSSG